MAEKGPIRVLVVDDSAFMRKRVTDLLQSDPQIQVVDTARDGLDAVAKAQALTPDVVTMDVEMPNLDGLGALREILRVSPRPVVMVSSLTQRGADTTIEALTIGAVDFVAKPSGAISLDLHKVQEELVRKVKAAATVRVRRLIGDGGVRPAAPGRAPVPLPNASLPLPNAPLPLPNAPVESPAASKSRPIAAGLFGSASPAVPKQVGTHLTRLTLVISSTGGPGALHRLIDPLPGEMRSGFVVVQHMPAGFTRSLANHLDQSSKLTVKEAEAGDRPLDGLVILAAGGQHLVFQPDGSLALNDAPPRHGVRPAGDITLESLPDSLVKRSLVIILTGMGLDGARGAKQLKDRGAEVWAQDEASCAVYGMPRAVAEVGVVDRIGDPEQLSAWLAERMV